jgi:predicted transposase YdaD
MVKTGAERGWYETVRDARLEGERIGELEGERKGKLETARNMLAFGESADKVVIYTGLPQETVSKLVQEAAG